MIWHIILFLGQLYAEYSCAAGIATAAFFLVHL
jgi:hypothetical protein